MKQRKMCPFITLALPILCAVVLLTFAATSGHNNGPPLNQSSNPEANTPVQNQNTCTPADTAACPGASSLPVCKRGEAPVWKGCCPSCKPAAHPRPTPCTRAQLEKCSASEASLPVCRKGHAPVLKGCCRTCKPAPPPQKQCTKAQVRDCVKTAPVCAVGESPVKVSGQCCPSCRRAQANCTPAEVRQCRKSLPVCKQGQKPERVAGSCCASCRPTRRKRSAYQ
jgi:hypothetical protein